MLLLAVALLLLRQVTGVVSESTGITSFLQLPQNTFLTSWPFISLLHQTAQKNGTSGIFQELNQKILDNYGRKTNTVTCYGDNGRPFEGFPCDHENCIPLSWLCDGERDCSGGVDERNCNQRRCPANKFQCVIRGSLTCINKDRVCDGRIDCQDGSDESSSQDCLSSYCQGAGKLSCSDGHGCISISKQCDGVEDCFDGSDEQNCSRCRPQFEFQCHNHNCIPQSWLCDGHDDCPEGEDELYYNCREHNTLQRNLHPILILPTISN